MKPDDNKQNHWRKEKNKNYNWLPAIDLDETHIATLFRPRSGPLLALMRCGSGPHAHSKIPSVKLSLRVLN